jgi:hypothetical protein
MSRTSDTVRALRSVDKLPTREEEISQQEENAVAEALGKKEPPVFNTHSTALAGEMASKGKAYVAMVADIDAKIAALQAERTDLMLAYSMLDHGMQARENAQ